MQEGCHYDCSFYIHTLLMYTNTRSIEAEWRLCFKTPTREVDLLQPFPDMRRVCCCRPILERL